MKLYTIKELELILKRKSKTIRNYINNEGLQASLICGRYLISENDLEKFIEKNK